MARIFPSTKLMIPPRMRLLDGTGIGFWGFAEVVVRGWHEAMVLVCLPLAAPIGLSSLHIPAGRV